MKQRRIALTGAVIAAIAVAAIALASGDDERAQTPQDAPPPVLSVYTTRARVSALPVRIPATGNIAAWQEASIGTEVEGLQLTEVKVNVGDTVRKGQVLALFKPDMVAAELAEACAAVAQARAQAMEAEVNARRARELDVSGAMSAQQVDQYTAAASTARARLDAAKAVERRHRLRLAQTRVLAPSDGVITARAATVGAVMPAGQELFRLIKDGRLEWRAAVAMADMRALAPGQPTQIDVHGQPPLRGRLRMVAPGIDPSTHNGLIYVDLPADGALHAGAFARGYVEVGQGQALTVPQDAVLLRDGFNYVMRLGPKSNVVMTKVSVGRRMGDRIEITAGFDGSEAIVASGLGFLSEGDTVRVVSDPATARSPARAAGDAARARRRRGRAMNLNVSTWSIHNPVATTLLFILLTIAGIGGFLAMKVQNFPDIDFPIVTVTAELPGASPPQLESDVARKIEDALANIPRIKHITTSLTDGVATVTAEFHLDKSVQEAMDDVRDAVSGTRADLPADLRDPVITKMELAGTPVMTYTVSSSRLDDEALSWFVDNQVRKRLLAVPGIGAVSRVGGVDREVRVALDPDQLLALNATAADISRQIRELQQEASGGRVDVGGAEQSVRSIATVASAEDIAALDVALGDGRRVRLDRVATVSDTSATPRSLALLDGGAAVGFDVLRARGAGEIDVARAAREVVRALAAAHPEVSFTEAVNAVDPIEDNYRGSMTLLLEGAALAVLVVFFFLRDWRATVIAAVALPLSAIPTFAAMHLMGFTLNTVSLLSLSLVIGVLVDDAIVEIENIERHLLMGKPPFRAAIEAADEIGLAVVATTFTLIAVFLPTSLMGGMVGKYFVQFGWTAAIAVFFSLVVARMLTPTMAAYMLKAPRRAPKSPAWIALYLRGVRGCLRHRAAMVAATVALIVGGLALATRLPGEFIPPDDGDRTQVTVVMPPGSTLADTRAMAERARLTMREHPSVVSVYTAIGGSTGSSDPGESAAPASITTAVLTANLVPRSARDGVTRQDVEDQLRGKLVLLPGARVSVGPGGDGEAYELVLASEDGALLARQASLVERELRGIPGVGAVTSSASLVRPELVVRTDFARAADLGVTSAAIAETLRIATAGDYSQALAKLNASERQVPIVVRLADGGRSDLDTLRRLPVPGARGPVPLESVATLQMLSGPSELTRYDRTRNVNLNVELNGRPLGDVERAAAALPSLRNLPNGVSVASTGDAEAMGELAAGFAVAMLAGVLCVYMVLVLLLKDFAQPVTVLVALALSVPGAFVALWLTGSTLSMPSMIGLIMLMGITTKNSILLVDYIVIARRDHAAARLDAILDACRKRARPIVMTTIAMGAGMLPIAIGLGADPSFRSPMAIGVIGGLITSTVLCLLVIPVVYSYVDDAIAWAKARFAGRAGHAIDGAAGQSA